jgi:hypothetical protein
MSIQFKAYKVTKERTCAPEPNEFQVGRNPSYLNSLVAGVLSPILHLPQILWLNSFWPLLKSLWRSLTFILLSMSAGFMGQANGFRTTGVKEHLMSDEEKECVLAEMLEGSGYVAVKETSVGRFENRS